MSFNKLLAMIVMFVTLKAVDEIKVVRNLVVLSHGILEAQPDILVIPEGECNLSTSLH